MKRTYAVAHLVTHVFLLALRGGESFHCDSLRVAPIAHPTTDRLPAGFRDLRRRARASSSAHRRTGPSLMMARADTALAARARGVSTKTTRSGPPPLQLYTDLAGVATARDARCYNGGGGMTTTTLLAKECGNDDDCVVEEVQAVGIPIWVTAVGAVALAGFSYMQLSDIDALAMVQTFDFASFLDDSVAFVEQAGPLGYAYFWLVYVVAEVLALPAVALTASAGYLFGVVPGTAIVLLAAATAASVSFLIGRTIGRDFILEVASGNDRFNALDKVISREGFKIVLLLRLSPLFPFALSNYLYGLTSVPFFDYFWGTLIGFAPGTAAYVYTGTMGKALIGGDSSLPWYGYVGVLALLIGIAQFLTDIATRAVEELEAAEALSTTAASTTEAKGSGRGRGRR